MTALTRFTSIWIGTMVLLLAVPAAEARPPRGHAAWNKRGQRDWKRDRIAAANQAFQTAIDLHYREQYLWNLGRSFEELGHPQRALAIYQWLSANSGDLGDRYLRKLPEARARASAAVGAPTSTDHPSVPILPSFECPRGMEPVPAGPYWRGSDTPRPDALSPVHLVYVSAFCIDRHEVSVSAYSRCVAAEKCRAG
ncbi:MAG: tetratricopeptide (TPR) repeat protein, partial [Myxococcota bacterium]